MNMTLMWYTTISKFSTDYLLWLPLYKKVNLKIIFCCLNVLTCSSSLILMLDFINRTKVKGRCEKLNEATDLHESPKNDTLTQNNMKHEQINNECLKPPGKVVQMPHTPIPWTTTANRAKWEIINKIIKKQKWQKLRIGMRSKIPDNNILWLCLR